MAEIKVPIQVNLPDDWIEQIVNRLRNDPESEWVEVVRCKDCKHRPIAARAKEGIFYGFSVAFPDNTCPCRCDDGFYSWYPKDNFYCGYAERRTDEL